MTFTLRAATFKRPTIRFPKWDLAKVPRNVAEIAAQAVGVLSVLVGVSMWSVPSAFVLGGLTLVFAIERQSG